MNLSLLLAAILTGFVSSVAGYCSEVTVTGAYLYPINGVYPLTYLYCEVSLGYNIWGQAYTTAPNFVYSYNGYWYIGLTICDIVVVAKSTVAGYGYPYDVPAGSWTEFYNEDLQPSPNMNIYCSRDTLSAGAIAGIVIGCVCGAILIIVIIVMIFNSVKKKKRNSHVETSSHPQTAVQAAAASSTTVTHVQVPSAVVYPNQAYYPPTGDVWPDYGGYSAPPAYQPPYDQQQQQPKNYGV